MQAIFEHSLYRWLYIDINWKHNSKHDLPLFACLPAVVNDVSCEYVNAKIIAPVFALHFVYTSRRRYILVLEGTHTHISAQRWRSSRKSGFEFDFFLHRVFCGSCLFFFFFFWTAKAGAGCRAETNINFRRFSCSSQFAIISFYSSWKLLFHVCRATHSHDSHMQTGVVHPGTWFGGKIYDKVLCFIRHRFSAAK